MRKGFTLIELLAVIVILAIILVIAVPQILGVIESSKRDSLSSSAMLVAKTVEQNVITDDTRPTTINCLDSKYGINNNDYETCTALVSYGDTDVIVSVDIVGKGKFDGYTVGATKSSSHVVDDTSAQSLKTVLLSTVGTKDVDINKYNGNGLYKWGSKYIYRGGITKTNPSGVLTNDQYGNDVDSGSEVSNYIKVPWETYTTGEDCTSTTNKCYRIIGINADGSITIIRDKKVSDQVFDSTHNTAASNNYSQPTTNYGYNDLLSNSYTVYPAEYRAYSSMYTYLYGTSGYENTVIKPYSSILQPLDVCLNKAGEYVGVNASDYATTILVKDICDVSGKPGTIAVSPLQNKYVRLPYIEEYLNASTESTCTRDDQYQCRNQNFIYQKQLYCLLNGHLVLSWYVRFVDASGHANYHYYASNSYGVRPVITLKSSVLITGGTGTQALPYVIKW